MMSFLLPDQQFQSTEGGLQLTQMNQAKLQLDACACLPLTGYVCGMSASKGNVLMLLSLFSSAFMNLVSSAIW